MILRLKDTVTLRLGMAFLAVANLSQWILRKNPGFDGDAIDGVTGLLFGLAIGCLVLYMVQARRRASGR